MAGENPRGRHAPPSPATFSAIGHAAALAPANPARTVGGEPQASDHRENADSSLGPIRSALAVGPDSDPAPRTKRQLWTYSGLGLRNPLQPDRHPLQFRSGTSEATYGLAVPSHRHGLIVRFVADVIASGVGMHDFRISHLCSDFRVTSRRCLRFIWCQLFCMGRQIAFLFFCGCLDFMRIFHSEFNWLGLVGDPYTVSPSGSDRCSFSEQRRPSIQSPVPEPCSFIGQERAKDDMRPYLPSLVVPQILICTKLLDTHSHTCPYSF